MFNLNKNKYTIDEVVQYITQKDDVSHMTIERKTGLLMAYLVVTLEELKRVKGPQKPLTLEELKAGDVVYIEFKDDDEIVPIQILPEAFSPNLIAYYKFGWAPRFNVDIPGCGRYWRCWRSMPTDEERKAAPWEVWRTEPEKINGKTAEQIKEALCICTSKSACALYRCPYTEYIEADNCKDQLMRDALALAKQLESENASLKVNMEHEAARSIQMVNEIADMTVDLDINVLLGRAGMQPYTHDTLSETFILRLAIKRVLDERDALMADVSNNCFVCANRKIDEKGNCVNAGGGIGCSHFVWRGPQEPTKEE